MSIRVYDGSTWNNQKSLQIYGGASWVKSKTGWIYNGASWSMFYPEFPANSVLPTLSGSATQGNTLTVSNGTWNTLDAYTGTDTGGPGTLTYSYQWKSAGSNVGTNSSSYQTQISDVGKAITCVVTATNFRGTTSVTSSNSITIQSAIPLAPASVTLTDQTATPTAPSSVSVSPLAQPDGQTQANVSWGASGGTFTFYAGQSSIGALINVNSSTRTANIVSGTPSSSVTASIRAGNTNGILKSDWPASTNATSYDVYIYNTTDGITLGPYNTSLLTWTQNVSTDRSYNVQVYAKNAAGSSTSAASSSTTINTKYSGFTNGFGTFNNQLLPSISGLTNTSKTDTTATLSWSSSNQAEYRVVGYTGWLSGSTTSYTLTGLSANTGYFFTVEIRSSTLNTASQGVSVTTNVTPVIPSFTSGPTVTGISSTGGTLSWTSVNQSSYSISAPGTALNGATGFTITSRLFTGLSAGQTYSYSVTITSSTGHTATGNGSFTTTGGSAPSTPTNLTNSYSGGTSYTFGWTDSAGATSYQVIPYHATDAAGAGSTAKTARNFTNGGAYDSSTDGGTTFTYVSFAVRATNSNGSSAYSGIYTPYR